jgi:phage gpG-like protein
MAGGIEIGVQFQENLSAALRQAAQHGGDLTPAMKEIAVYLEGVSADRFAHGVGPGGVRWKVSERVREHGGQTLVLSGDLQTSVHAETTPSSVEIGPERSFGSAVYAAIHQFGGTIRAKVKKALHFGGRIVASVYIPARPYVGFDEPDQNRMAEILTDFMKDAFGGGVPA